jgi:hypothetical protein
VLDLGREFVLPTPTDLRSDMWGRMCGFVEILGTNGSLRAKVCLLELDLESVDIIGKHLDSVGKIVGTMLD